MISSSPTKTKAAYPIQYARVTDQELAEVLEKTRALWSVE
jgi:hypothetical protein